MRAIAAGIRKALTVAPPAALPSVVNVMVEMMLPNGPMRLAMARDEKETPMPSSVSIGILQLLRFLLDEAQLAPAEADNFIARGMLINTLTGLRMELDPDPAGSQLADRVLKNSRPAVSGTAR